MKSTFICLFLILNSITIYSQKLVGVVLEKELGRPVSNANVYLEGTSIYAVTDGDGRFELITKEKLNTNLIISHVSYEVVIISEPYHALPDTFFLEEKILLVGEVVIKPEEFSREQKLKSFRQQFLGTSRSARSCEILNEDDIVLTYDKEERLLSAICYKPILIENKYLGYKIHLDLNYFNIHYRGKTIRGDDISSVGFEGSFYFEDVRPPNETIRRRRYQTYDGSSLHFLRTITNGKWKRSDNLVYRDPDYILYTDKNTWGHYAENCFKIVDSLSFKKVKIDSSLLVLKATYEGRPYVAKAYVLRDQKQSELIFFKEQFTIDSSGLLQNPEDILFRGHMGTQRIGDQLPIDYGL